jgi:uncharacterized protein (AIM24 family)
VAQFEIVEEQGMRFVRVVLDDETIQAESGAMAYYRGNVTMTARIPSVAAVIRAGLSEEHAVRPTYAGRGEVVLQSSLSGYHVLDLEGEAWIIDAGAYWASESSVILGAHRETVVNAFWGGEGLIEFRTRLSGAGKAVLTTQGPVDEVVIPAGEEIAVEHHIVIGRTEGIRYTIRRAANSYLASRLSGEHALKVYRGPGRVLMCSTPYWSGFLLDRVRRP